MKRGCLILLLMAFLLPSMSVAQDSPCPAESNDPWAQVVLRTNGYLTSTQMTLGSLFLGSDELSKIESLEATWDVISGQWDENAFPDDLAVLKFAGTRLADAMVSTLPRIRVGDATEAEMGALSATIAAYQDALLDVGFGNENCPNLALGEDVDSVSASSTAFANAEQTITAQHTEIAELVRIAAQQAESSAAVVSTVEAAAVVSTTEALAIVSTAEAVAVAQTTMEAQAAEIEPTVNALGTRQAASNATATALAQRAEQGSIDPSKVEFSIDVDYDGLINGDPEAIEEASDTLAEVLAPYDGCRVGLSLTFGWSSDLQTGIAVAQAVNQILADDFPDIFSDAALEDFASLQDPPGRVDLEFFFYKGCEAIGT